MIFLWIVIAIVGGIGLLTIGLTITAKVLDYKDSLTSTAAKKIVSLYNQVPEASRPYGDIKEMLSALDLKYGIDDVNKHYRNTNRTYDGLKTEFAWYPRDCYHKHDGYTACKYPEYIEIAKALESIISAHKKQQRALEIAGVQGNLDMVKQFTEQARQETKIIDSVTKELER